MSTSKNSESIMKIGYKPDFSVDNQIFVSARKRSKLQIIQLFVCEKCILIPTYIILS